MTSVESEDLFPLAAATAEERRRGSSGHEGHNERNGFKWEVSSSPSSPSSASSSPSSGRSKNPRLRPSSAEDGSAKNDHLMDSGGRRRKSTDSPPSLRATLAASCEKIFRSDSEGSFGKPGTIDSLPNEILMMIFSCLRSEKDLLNVCLVCTRWKSLMDSEIVWQTILYRRYQRAGHLDLLMSTIRQHQQDTVLETFASGANPTALSAPSPSMPSSEPADSPYGSREEGASTSAYISTLAFYSPANSPSLASPVINRKRFNTLDAYYCSLSRSPLSQGYSTTSSPSPGSSNASSNSSSTTNSSSNPNSSSTSNSNSTIESENSNSSSNSGHRSDPDYFDIEICWKKFYLNRLKEDRRWKFGRLEAQTTLSGHTEEIRCMALHGSRIITGSLDRSVRIWDLNSYSLIGTLQNNASGVLCLKANTTIKDGELSTSVITGNADRTIKVWKLKDDSGSCTHTVHGHTGEVECIALDDRILVSGSRDTTLRLWNATSFSCFQVFEGHRSPINCVELDSGKIVSASCDKTIKVWDVATGVCIKTITSKTIPSGKQLSFPPRQRGILCSQFSGDKIVVGTSDCYLEMYDLNSMKLVRSTRGHNGGVTCLKYDEDKMITGGRDNAVKLWDWSMWKVVHTVTSTTARPGHNDTGHRGAITALDFSNNALVTASNDKTAIVWSPTMNPLPRVNRNVNINDVQENLDKEPSLGVSSPPTTREKDKCTIS